MIGLALLAVFGVGLGSLSYTLALKTKDREWLFWGVQQTLIFPLLILSGMLLPLDAAPAWMRAVSTVNPINWVVQAERALFAGDLGSITVLWGWARSADPRGAGAVGGGAGHPQVELRRARGGARQGIPRRGVTTLGLGEIPCLGDGARARWPGHGCVTIPGRRRKCPAAGTDPQGAPA